MTSDFLPRAAAAGSPELLSVLQDVSRAVESVIGYLLTQITCRNLSSGHAKSTLYTHDVLVCTHCQHRGHSALQCHRKQNLCFHCGQSSHFVKDCPRKTQNSWRKTAASDCKTVPPKFLYGKDDPKNTLHEVRDHKILSLIRDAVLSDDVVCQLCDIAGHSARTCNLPLQKVSSLGESPGSRLTDETKAVVSPDVPKYSGCAGSLPDNLNDSIGHWHHFEKWDEPDSTEENLPEIVLQPAVSTCSVTAPRSVCKSSQRHVSSCRYPGRTRGSSMDSFDIETNTGNFEENRLFYRGFDLRKPVNNLEYFSLILPPEMKPP